MSFENHARSKTMSLKARLFGRAFAVSVALSAAALIPATAMAGRGSSPGAIQRAIGSGSVEAVESELERAEHLVCAACVPMVKKLVDHDEVRVRRVATWWLARRGLRSQLFVQMTMRLAQADSRLARNAADVLGELRHPKAVEPLGAALQNRVYDEDARAAFAHALGEIGEVGAQPSLEGALSAESPRVRAAALAAMRDLRGFSDGRAAAAALGDSDAKVRTEAVFTLGYLREGALAVSGDGAARDLVKLVEGDPEASVRKRAAWALGEIRAPSSIAGPALQKASERDSDPRVRSLAAAALTRLAP
jgi:HEAT repeat protein